MLTVATQSPASLYWILNKPKGVLSTVRDPQGRPKVTDWLPDAAERVYPVGRLDRDTEGLVLLTRARELYPETPTVLTHLAVCQADAGEVDEVRRLLGELEEWDRTAYVDPVNLAAVHLSLGEDDEAFTWLERGYEIRAVLLTQLRIVPGIDRLHSDPRYGDLLRRMNYPEAS